MKFWLMPAVIIFVGGNFQSYTDAVCGKTAKQNMDTGQIQLLYAAN